jgi:hypothetical protein
VNLQFPSVLQRGRVGELGVARPARHVLAGVAHRGDVVDHAEGDVAVGTRLWREERRRFRQIHRVVAGSVLRRVLRRRHGGLGRRRRRRRRGRRQRNLFTGKQGKTRRCMQKQTREKKKRGNMREKGLGTPSPLVRRGEMLLVLCIRTKEVINGERGIFIHRTEELHGRDEPKKGGRNRQKEREFSSPCW